MLSVRQSDRYRIGGDIVEGESGNSEQTIKSQAGTRQDKRKTQQARSMESKEEKETNTHANRKRDRKIHKKGKESERVGSWRCRERL